MNAILENNRAYQFAQLESALRSEQGDQAQAALAKLRQLGVEVQLSQELKFLADQIERSRQEPTDASKRGSAV